VEFFLDLARTGGPSGRGLKDALLPVVLADVQDVWKDLMGLAKDRSIRSDTRSSALFWVSQEAAAVVTEGLAEVAMDQDEDQDVREAAVFALSQRPSDESVPILMELAKTADHPETRRSAMFWLAQSKDDRVLDFFEEILLGKGGV
jgi:HEAT repeat protein